jgi:hypothetical protein
MAQGEGDGAVPRRCVVFEIVANGYVDEWVASIFSSDVRNDG